MINNSEKYSERDRERQFKTTYVYRPYMYIYKITLMQAVIQ